MPSHSSDKEVVMPVKTILGLDAKLYRNSGTYVSPTWSEIPNVKDLSLTLEKSEADVSTRASAWSLVKGALKSATIDFNMVYDPGDTNWAAFKAAYLGNTPVECAILDGGVAVDGTEGLRASCEVLKWSHTQNLEEALMTEISLKPTRAENAPEWMVVDDGTTTTGA
jgi:hypothetical protein